MKIFKDFFSYFALGLIFLNQGFLPNINFHSKEKSDFRQQIEDTNIVRFSKISGADMVLDGPFDADSIYFSLPPSWRLLPGAQLDLDLTASFTKSTNNETTVVEGALGTITVFLNDVFIGDVQISLNGDTTAQFSIPVTAFDAIGLDGFHQLRFSFESGWTCELDESMRVIVRQTSRMTLPHEILPPNVDLINFPAQIFQRNSVIVDPLTIVIPGSPTAAELQGALTVVAGFGNMSSETLPFELITLNQLTPEIKTKTNLIFIGNVENLPLLDQLALPVPPVGGKFLFEGGEPDDGFVQLVVSPWESNKVVLVVAGNEDAGVIKAAQAVSTGTIRRGTFPNLAVVNSVTPAALPPSVLEDQTLGEMGYDARILNSIGTNYVGYQFYIPPGKTLAKDAYFDLNFGHSALIQYERSGIVAYLNSRPIGSVAFTKETASTPNNIVRLAIPPSAVTAGNNYLELRVSLYPIDRCSDPNLSALFGTIWPESNLHLPLVDTIVAPSENYNLIYFPSPFAFNDTLDTTAFVLPKNDLSSWRSAARVAAYLGNVSNASMVTFSSFYADELPEDTAVRGSYNFIVFGKPVDLPVLGDLNDYLPAPFDFTEKMIIEPDMQVRFRIDPDSTIGYIEALSSPWNKSNVIVLAVGNNSESVDWAASYLIEPLSYQLSGNFAAINNSKIYTTDTRLVTITPNIITAESPVLEVSPPANLDLQGSPPFRPAWMLPALFTSLILTIVIIVVAFLAWSRNRGVKKKPGQ